MHIDLARHTIRVAFQCGRELVDLMQMLQAKLEPEEYQDYALAIAGAVDAVNVALIDKACAKFPELKAEIDAKITQHGRYI